MGSTRTPRDAQRSRVYLAETPLPSSPLPGLDACATFADRVVGTFWWQARFPEHTIDAVPRLRPGNGARQAFFRVDPDGPTITLPRRYRTKGVVLHELVHWAMADVDDLPHHGRTFARILLDATAEFCGPDRADALAARYRDSGVHVARPARQGPDGRWHYGWDERLRLGKGRRLTVHHHAAGGGLSTVTSVFAGFETGGAALRFAGDGPGRRVRTADVWRVEAAPV